MLIFKMGTYLWVISKYHKNRCSCVSLKWVTKSSLNFQFWECWQACIFSTLFLPTWNEGQNNSKSNKNSAYFRPWFDQPWSGAKIDPNIIKIGVHAYLSNGYLNPLSKLNGKKVNKSASFQPWFDKPWMWAKITPNLIKIGVHVYLSNGYLNLL